MARRKSVVKQLSNLSLDEISLVDVGANQHARLVISKRFEDDDVSKGDPDVTDLHEDDDDEYDDVETAKQFTTDDNGGDSINYVDDVDKCLPGQPGAPGGMPGAMGGSAPGGVRPPGAVPNAPGQFGQPAAGPQNFPSQGFPAPAGQMPGQMQMGQPQLPPEVIQYIKSLEMQVAQAQGADKQSVPNSGDNSDNSGDKVNPFGKSLEGDDLSSDEMSFLEELAKNLDDEDTRETISKALEAVAKAQERAEKAEEIAKSERDLRLEREFVSKAQAYTVGVAADELGPVLKRLNESMTPEDVAVIEKALASASAQNDTPFNLFSEVGKRGGGDNGDVMARVDAEAQELISKGATPEQARAQVYERNPRLYDEFVRSSGR